MTAKAPQAPRPVPTLEDVARLAGVSTATVSRCLNTPDRVVKSTRTRVMAAVDQLGYAPNFGARALAAKRTNTIGAIIPTMENAIFARGLQAFQEELGLNGMTLLVASSSYSEEVEREQIRTLCARGADALLLIGHHRSEETLNFLEARSVPVLVAWVYDPENSRPSIGFDNRAAMREMAELVISKGHRRIGVISAPCAANDRASERLAGIQEAMAAHGMPAEDLSLIETPYSIENGGQTFRQMMTTPTPPTAIMCGNDVLAVGALRAAREMGLSVPGDVSITGFDDIELAQLVTPALTTVHVPHRDMGRMAARFLVQQLNGEGPVGSVRLDTYLCDRETLGPAPA
ncbi:LacI family DNA-binding transcriptional regulator [Nioella aestuarii]|uniref:LacI family DNA-binding transcriptional regulator n=1 Tax=Nioella aestuarii TaxID=1662864 RepID=UPI003D7F5EFC